jgi:copper chaperone CopZ
MMKKFFLIIAILFSLGANAQFKSATLQAAGLTCSMCSKSISKALQQLSFVEKVTADIQSSQFEILFRDSANVDADALRQAVESAGFSVSQLRLTGNFTQAKVDKDAHLLISGQYYHFVAMNVAAISGQQSVLIVDKNFLSPKAYKKYSKASVLSCLQTGRSGDCCSKAGIAAGTRIFHVTL